MTAPGGRDFEIMSPATVTGMLAASELMPGDRIASRFVIKKLLGMGGMGVVHLARDEQLGIDVALKLLRPELASRPDAFERFRNELLLARQVSSPHVVRIHDLVQHGNAWLLCMDYVPGQSLEHLIDVEGGLAPDRALNLVRQIALGLAAAHHRGVIHRDLKPANVLVKADDEALITDFGVARSLGATGLTLSGVIVGTPEYLSPEQARAEPVDGRSDLYALGLILHEMLTGKVPFQGGTPAEMLAQRIVRSPPSVASVNAGLPAFAVALCDRLLDVRPARRLQDAQAVVRAIDEARLPRSPWSGQQRTAALILLAVLCVLGGLALQMPPDGWGEPKSVAVAAPRPALAIIPGPQPESELDRALQLGVERALTAQLLSSGVDVLDSIRVERNLQELGIARGQVGRMRPRLLQALAVREVLELELTSAGNQASVEVKMRDGGSGGVLWQERIVASNGEDIDTLLSRLWGALARRLKAPLHATDFANAAQLRRLAAVSPLLGAESIEGQAPGAGSSADEWWWALETLERDGRLTEAKNAAREVMQISLENDSPSWQRVFALAEYLTGAPEEALQRINRLPVTASNQPLRQLRARVFIALGRYEDAADELRALVERDPRNVDAWYLLGKSQLMMGDSQVAVDDALTRALVSANRLGDKRMQADVTNALGIGYRQLGQIDAAGDQFERAASMRKALGDLLGHAASLRNLAAVRSIQGRFAEADATLTEARATIEPIGDPAAMADLANDIGQVAEERGDFASALSAYREALGFRQVSGNPRWIAESLLNVGFAYNHVGEFDNAQVFLQQAEQAYSTIDDRAGAIRAQQGLGLSAMARGNFAESRRIVSASLQAAESLQMREEQSTAQAALAELDRLEGDYAAALAKVASAAAFFAEQGDLRGNVEMHLQMAAIQLDLGDWEAAATRIATLTEQPIANVEQRALLRLRQARLANETSRSEEAKKFALEGLELATTAGAAAAEIGNRIEHTRALLALGQTRAAKQQIVAAESGLNRFASVPLRLDLLQLRLRLIDEKGLAYRDARSLISKLPAYGQEWRIAALASRRLPEAERAEATQRATRSIEQIAVKLDQPARTKFRTWASSELTPGSQPL